MKKIKSFLTVFLSVLLLVNATSLNLVNANDGDTSDVSQEGQNVEGEPEEIKTYEVHYVAIAADNPNQFDVPDEVVALMPQDHTAITNEVVDPEMPSANSVGSWTFSGYEPGWAVVEDEDLWFYGVWVDSEASEEDNSFNGMFRSSTITSGFSGGWSLSGGTYTGSNAFKLYIDGSAVNAYCIDHARRVPAAGTVYTSSGTTSNREAEIIMISASLLLVVPDEVYTVPAFGTLLAWSIQ